MGVPPKTAGFQEFFSFTLSLQHFIKITIKYFYQFMPSVVSTLGYFISAVFSIFACSCRSEGVNVSYDFHSLISPRKVVDSFSLLSFLYFFFCFCKVVSSNHFQALYMLGMKLRQVLILSIMKENTFFKCLAPSNYHIFIFTFQYFLCLSIEHYEDD